MSRKIYAEVMLVMIRQLEDAIAILDALPRDRPPNSAAIGKAVGTVANVRDYLLRRALADVEVLPLDDDLPMRVSGAGHKI